MEPKLSVSQFINVVNDLLGSVYESLLIEGEVASFKISQGKFVFFDLKDLRTGDTVNVFMMKYQLTIPLEDGMKIIVRGRPKLTAWGKFSLTALAIQPLGKGTIKKAFDILKEKLTKEGLFAPSRKQKLPEDLHKIQNIGVISSTSAAGFIDFIKILGSRSGAHKITVANTVVQGIDAPKQIIKALQHLDQMHLDVIAIIRGGGSKDDLAAFNDEALVRAVAQTKTLIISGVGHEVDVSLVDLAADIRAATPSNAAELLTFEPKYDIIQAYHLIEQIREAWRMQISEIQRQNHEKLADIKTQIQDNIRDMQRFINETQRFLEAVNPEVVLKKGYALVLGELKVGNLVKIETYDKISEMEVKHVSKK
jgi:exodeoxyribonuclease VII large subunit